MGQALFDFTELIIDDSDEPAPTCRSQCRDGVRPCPWLRCKEHMFWALDPTKRRKLSDDAIVDLITEGLPRACMLDVVEEGEHTLEEVGDILGVSREMIRQIQDRGLRRLAHPRRKKGLRELLRELRLAGRYVPIRSYQNQAME